MVDPDWTYAETVQSRIRIIKINHKERHLDAQDIDAGVPFCLDAADALDLGKVKKAKVYRATIKVYTSQLDSEQEQRLTEMALTDERLRHSLQTLKANGYTLKKYELTALK